MNTVGVLDYTKYKYCLAGTDVRQDRQMDIPTEKVIPRPASAFGDAGKNNTLSVIHPDLQPLWGWRANTVIRKSENDLNIKCRYQIY